MALINCPHCGLPISDSAAQCPHCQKQIVTASQRNRTRKYSLVAMWLCIVGLVFYLIADSFFEFSFYPTVATLLTSDELGIWLSDHKIEITLMDFIGALSALCICLAWLVWFVREKSRRDSFWHTGVVICIIGVCVRMLRIIPNETWTAIWGYDYHLTSTFFIATTIIASLLYAVLGTCVICMKTDGTIKRISNVAGILFIVNSLYNLILVYVTDIAKIMQYATMSPLLKILYHFLWVCAIVVFIVLFYKTYKQAKTM